MKNSLYIVIALLAGLVLGNWSVQSDLRKARKENTQLQQQLAARGRRDSSLQNITSMLRVPEPVTAADRPQRSVVTNAVATTTPVTNAAPRSTMQDQIKTGIELWKTRSELARNGFLGNINASPGQTQMFDQAITNMNQQLSAKIQQWADYLKQQPDIAPESGLRMMNDLSGTVIEAYDELDRVLAPGWRDQAGAKFQLFDFINPEVALPLSDLEGAFHRSR